MSILIRVMIKLNYYTSILTLSFIIPAFFVYTGNTEGDTSKEKEIHQKQPKATTDKKLSLEPVQGKINNVNVCGYLKLADDSEWPLLLEDGEYPIELIDEIVADINLLYSRFINHRFLLRTPTRKFLIGGQNMNVNSYLSVSNNKGYILPKPFFDNFGDVLEINGKKHIVISKTLIQEYDKALRFKNEHKDEFRKLTKSLSFINGLKDASVLSDDELTDFFYVYAYGTKVLTLEIARSNVNEVPCCIIRRPSLLDITMINDGVNDLIHSFRTEIDKCF